jgi:predicted cupin superfamily sugar epimerase
MHPRALALIETLLLTPHPEGGYFREVFRSSETVTPSDGRRHAHSGSTRWWVARWGQALILRIFHCVREIHLQKNSLQCKLNGVKIWEVQNDENESGRTSSGRS